MTTRDIYNRLRFVKVRLSKPDSAWSARPKGPSASPTVRQAAAFANLKGEQSA